MQNFKPIIAVAGASALLAGCGLNPWGAGQSGLKIFAGVAKAVQKPSQIDDEKNSKDGVAAVVATGAARRLAKGTAVAELGVDSATIISHGGDKYTYIEYMNNKPSEEDPGRLLTGVGKVSFTYGPGDPDSGVVEGNITAIDSFHFNGRENTTWKAEVCSLVLSVTFEDPLIASLKPGLTWAWARNITGDIARGDGDTAFVAIDELDTVEKKQYGRGHFLDAHTGDDNTGESYAFDFGFEVWHMDDNPAYSDYSNNEGELSFALPWGASSDSLHFQIHFYSLKEYPNYRRTGTIKESDGTLRVQFDWNEKTGTGWVTYYNEDGKEIETDTN
jgi:hypothetical protein